MKGGRMFFTGIHAVVEKTCIPNRNMMFLGEEALYFKAEICKHISPS